MVLAAPEGPVSDSEVKNRREIEAAWLNMWHLYEQLDRIPPAKVDQEFAKFAYGPALAEFVDTTKTAQKQQIINTGQVRHRLWWEPPVADRDIALVIDCLDLRKFGSYDRKTDQPYVMGDKFREYEVSAFKDSGKWKVSKVIVTDRSCSF